MARGHHMARSGVSVGGGDGAAPAAGYNAATEPELMACMVYEDMLFLEQLRQPEVYADFLCGRILSLKNPLAVLNVLTSFHCMVSPCWSPDPIERHERQRSVGTHLRLLFEGCLDVISFPNECNNELRLTYRELMQIMSQLASCSYWQIDKTRYAQHKSHSFTASQSKPKKERSLNLVSIQKVDEWVEHNRGKQCCESSGTLKSSLNQCERTYPSRTFHNSRFKNTRYKRKEGLQEGSKSKNYQITNSSGNNTGVDNSCGDVISLDRVQESSFAVSQELPAGLLETRDISIGPMMMFDSPVVSSPVRFPKKRRRRKRNGLVGKAAITEPKDDTSLEMDSDFGNCVSFVSEAKRQSEENKKVLDRLRCLENDYAEQLKTNSTSCDEESSEETEEDDDESSEDSSSSWKDMNISSTSMSEESDHGKNMVQRKLEDWSFDSWPDGDDRGICEKAIYTEN